MNRLVIIGASGHGKVVADIARLNGYEDIVFLDDGKSVVECSGFPVIGDTNTQFEGDVFVAIGNAASRKKMMDRFANYNQPILIHPSAVIAKDVEIGTGSVVMAGAIINPGVTIGRGCIINTSSSVDHDSVLGNFVHVAVGAHICGTVSVGNDNWIGAGAIIINNISVCEHCMIGAGAVVVSIIDCPGLYVGVPAHFQRNL